MNKTNGRTAINLFGDMYNNLPTDDFELIKTAKNMLKEVDSRQKIEIRTTEEIQEWKQQPVESDNNLNWVRTAQIVERINHIRDVIRECSFEDDFGEQCFKYCDLNNMFKILESELNKPEVNRCLPLDVKQDGGNGIPPTNKLVGILPKRL